MSSASDATPLCSPCDSATSTSSGRTSHPVYSLYTCIDVFNQYWECKACGWRTKGGSVRRKMEHSLGTKTGNARSCQKAAEMCEETQELLSEALVELDRREADKRKRKEVSRTSTASLVVPKRQKKLAFGATEELESMHMEYARMCVMSAVKTNFLESQFTKSFFEVNLSLHIQLTLGTELLQLTLCALHRLISTTLHPAAGS